MKIAEKEKVEKTKHTRKKDVEPVRQLEHPLEEWLRMDRIPHIWCSTCGIGTAVTCFIESVKKSTIPRKDFANLSLFK